LKYLPVVKLPKSLTTVTTLSKTLAAVLFITFPFLGFYLGMQYEKGINSSTITPPDTNPTPTNNSVFEPSGQACTDEAKICPDGSTVGRTGPNCEFARCPGTNTYPKTACEQSGGKWLAKYNECEASSGGLDEKTCKELGGVHKACDSACRHDPNAQGCIEVCINVCKF
jgi:hypothetical protein